MQYIKKIKLLNFKRFKEFEIEFNDKTNIIIGGNESGKSSIIQAIELIASGSRNRVETIGIESLLNRDAIVQFFRSDKSFEQLPEIHVELYLGDETNPDLYGRNNSEGIDASGLHMVCLPNEDLSAEINQVLAEDGNFPFEFYVVKFFTFNGEAYSGYRRFLKYLTIDNSQINTDYANKEYTKTVYESSVEMTERTKLSNRYRQAKQSFVIDYFQEINDGLEGVKFSVKSNSKSNLNTDIALLQDSIPIDERGKGHQCFIKTEFALTRSNGEEAIHSLLLEEPENHLSHVNMKRLISKISQSHENQIIITTHNSLISTRLDLRNAILLNSSSEQFLKLDDIDEDTAKFFMKAPDNNILEFVLSSKVILVEGDAEYILMEALYSKATGRTLDEDNIHVISVGGTSFKRYMTLASRLNIKVAVIRDNDGDYQKKCVDNYSDFVAENIIVFSDEDNSRYTFEVCLYQDNAAICDKLIEGNRVQKSALDWMLDNKAETAFKLTDNYFNELVVPEYIQKAIEWINE
ncbi:ATP-dependent nuclease [Thiomicrorhabdus sediminis]|uniref:ATP-dependent endonuclease n=1 Tax=Thiomicrorhabdus sediminis TaxID=2580412 RepID=A0A4P9K499_9GAMM|nr:TOPRIM nucleotidyl transferase/hydrolase domain-containing protein [Thiomicrorhabdus sediminis]QCU89784.1 ATP-dependent endonuclease [Thiomicrorhabdus sediminis]